jgi:hypothetical protein
MNREKPRGFFFVLKKFFLFFWLISVNRKNVCYAKNMREKHSKVSTLKIEQRKR